MENDFPPEREKGILHTGHTCEEEGISLRELLLVLIKGKKIIITVTAVLMICTLFVSLILTDINLRSKGEVQTAVKLYFEGIETGMTPKGLAYDPNEIKSAEVLQRALDNMAIKNKPSTSQIAACISLTAVLSEDAAKTLQNISGLKTEELKLNRLEELKINPDTYILSLDVKNKLGLSLEEGRELLDNVALAYKQQLLEKYSQYPTLPNVFAGDFSIEKYDFIQAADLMNEQLINMEQYVQANMTDELFTSQSTGMSKQDLLNSIEAVRNINIEMIYTKIAVSYATKDAPKSVAIYEKLAEDKELIYKQKNEEAGALYNMIVGFKTPEQTLVISDGAEEPYPLKNQNAQYDSMVSRYIEAGSNATDALADSEYYKLEAERFKNAQDFSGPESEAAKEIAKLLEIAKENITKNTELVNLTMKNYFDEKSYQKYGEQLIPTQSYPTQSSINMPLNMAISLVAGMILGILIVLFREYLKTEEREDEIQ